MRLVLCFLLIGSVAYADATAIQALAKKNVVDLGKLADDDDLGFTEDAIVIDPMGTPIDLAQEDGCVTGAVANDFYGCNQGSFVHKVAKVDVGVDVPKGIAWFQVPFTVLASHEDESGKTKTSREPMRTSGIAIKVGGEWKIVAQLYAKLVSDKQLLAGTGGKPASGAPKLTGDQKLAKTVAGWFTSGFAKASDKPSPSIIASGTSDKEHQWGDAALKLVASFDKLKLGATSIDARVLAGGKIGWVTATVMLPRKTGKGAVELKLALVVVPAGDSWKWVSLQYQRPWNPVGG